MKKAILPIICLLTIIAFIIVIKVNGTLPLSYEGYKHNKKYEHNFINDSVLSLSGRWLKEELDTHPNTNIVISPVSLYLATAMLAEGADERAYTELSEILGTKGIPLPEFNQAIQKSSALHSRYAKIANSIWGNRFENTFKDLVEKNLDAEIKKIPSNTNPINSWVKRKTEGKIPNILSYRRLDDHDTFLINAIYFKADWLHPFEVSLTRKKAFHTPSGTVSVDMMSKTEDMPYYEDDIMQAVILTYKGSQDNMTIYLPKKEVAWNDFISHLTKNNFRFNFRSEEVYLGLPRFDIDYSADTLVETLKKWNITSIFEIGSLEGVGMNTWIRDIIHKAKVKVDEKGTVAAAVTVYVVSFGDTASRGYNVWVDHPFIFKINDGLFVGSIVSPNQ